MYENLCEFIKNELKELDRKVASGGKLSMQEVDFADKLAHMKKSILTVDAMEHPEQYYEGEYSRGGYRESYGDPYERRMYPDGYGAGRGNGAQRDSMGRYAANSRMYRDGGMMTELEDLESMAPNEQVRRRFREFREELKGMM